MNDTIIETHDLTVYYGTHRGILNIDLSVEKGEVFGFLGPNGAGKTTAMRVLLDMIRPTSGRASIFGLSCEREGVSIRKRVGYLPGEFSPYAGMKGLGFLNLMASLQEKKIDHSYVRDLCDRLHLDPSRRIKQYSHGNRQKVGVIAAFMGKPDLYILDEPTVGLDPIAQQTVVELVKEAREDGRTVFLSSHIMSEVQSICDRVGIIRKGRLIKTEYVETLIGQQLKKIHLTLRETPPPDAFDIEGVRETGRVGQTIRLDVHQSLEKVLDKALQFGVEDIKTPQVTLEEIFLTLYDRTSKGDTDA